MENITQKAYFDKNKGYLFFEPVETQGQC